MQIRPEELKRPNKDRSGLEKTFKWANKIITAVQLGCLLLSIANVTISAERTLDSNMWGLNQLSVSSTLVTKIGNCSVTRTSTIGASTGVTYTVSATDLPFLLAELCYDLKVMIVVVAAVIFIAAINKLMFDLNIYKLLYGQMIFRKDVVSVLDFCGHVFCIVIINSTATAAEGLKALFERCAGTGQNTLPYTPPFPELYFAMSLGLLGHLITGTAHVVISQRDDPDDEVDVDAAAVVMDAPRATNQQQKKTVVISAATPVSGDELRTVGATVSPRRGHAATGSRRPPTGPGPNAVASGGNRGREL